ncbi:hypothetical protein QLX67_04085 [Balneolaceae bacterium ANBcel3]|nr:hypothetical protein [Balneolaceae bacterium ANBcel3]
MNEDIIVPIVAILSVFGIGGFITLKFISFMRDWLVPKEPLRDNQQLLRRIDQYEQRQELLIKRIQNLETILVDSDSSSPKLKEADLHTINDTNRDSEIADRPLKNKLRS